jgi:predicted Mrr-cat superfamily restriction endonuclease
MRIGGFVAIGFPLGENLSSLVRRPRELESLIKRVYPTSSSRYILTTVTRFVLDTERGDIVVAANGAHNLGIGRVTGDYEYDDRVDGAPPDRRKVEWLNLKDWLAPVWEGRTVPEGFQRTLFQLQHDVTLRAINARIPPA